MNVKSVILAVLVLASVTSIAVVAAARVIVRPDHARLSLVNSNPEADACSEAAMAASGCEHATARPAVLAQTASATAGMQVARLSRASCPYLAAQTPAAVALAERAPAAEPAGCCNGTDVSADARAVANAGDCPHHSAPPAGTAVASSPTN